MRLIRLILALLCIPAFAGQTNINIGASPNDATGDTLRSAFIKVNTNFTEVYTALREAGFLLIGSTNSTMTNAVTLVPGAQIYFTTNVAEITINATGGTNGSSFTFNEDQFELVTSTNVYITAGALITNAVLTTPTIADFTSAGHTHTNAAGGGTLDGTAIGSGTIPDARIPSGITRDTEWDTSLKISGNVTDETGTGFLVFGDSPSITTPTLVQPSISDFVNAQHGHTSTATGGSLSAASVTSGTFATARLGGPGASTTNFLKGTGSWAQPNLATDVTGTLDEALIDSEITRDTEWNTAAALEAALGADGTGTGLLVFNTNATLSVPVIDSFVNSQHNHASGATGGQLGASALNDTDEYTLGIVNAKFAINAADGTVTNTLTVLGDLLAGSTNVAGALAGKQPIDSTLTTLSGKTFTGTESIVLSNAPTTLNLTNLGTLTGSNATFSASVSAADADLTGTLTVGGDINGTNITLSGSAEAATGTFSQGLAVNGSGAVNISPYSLTDLSGDKYATYFGWSGGSTNGTNVSLWSADVPNAHTMRVHADISADMTNHVSRGDVLDYEFRRADAGSATLQWTNHLRSAASVTNHWISVSANTVTLWASATNDAVMTTRGFGWWTTNAIYSATYAPFALWDFEEAGKPAGFAESGSSTFNYEYTADPLAGLESFALTSDGTVATLHSGAQTAVDEVWLGAIVRLSGNPAAATSLLQIRNNGFAARVNLQINTDRTIRVTQTGGSDSAWSATPIATTGETWIMVYAKLGTGLNAIGRVWITTNPATGWGTPLSSTDGTWTDQVNRWSANLAGGVGAGFIGYWDDVIWEPNQEIDADYYVP